MNIPAKKQKRDSLTHAIFGVLAILLLLVIAAFINMVIAVSESYTTTCICEETNE